MKLFSGIANKLLNFASGLTPKITRFFGLNAKGEQMVDKIVGIAVALLVAAIILPIAIDELVGIDTSAWPASIGTLMTVLLPIMAVIGIILYITRRD